MGTTANDTMYGVRHHNTIRASFSHREPATRLTISRGAGPTDGPNCRRYGRGLPSGMVDESRRETRTAGRLDKTRSEGADPVSSTSLPRIPCTQARKSCRGHWPPGYQSRLLELAEARQRADPPFAVPWRRGDRSPSAPLESRMPDSPCQDLPMVRLPACL
jgi:hypothetical protein